jgi:hypothetical protein
MRHLGTGKELKPRPRFRDIMRDENWYPSLAIFQFLLWTAIVLFTYFGTASHTHTVSNSKPISNHVISGSSGI